MEIAKLAPGPAVRGILAGLLGAMLGFGQTYAIQTLAGSYPLNNGGPATSAYLYDPAQIASDGQGNIFVVDQTRIRRFQIGGTMSTFAGPEHPGEATRPTAVIDADFITGLTVDSTGNVYYSAFNACVIRRITPAGVVSVVAGILDNCSTGADAVAATASAINRPYGLVFDRQNRLLFVDYFGRRVRRVDADGRVATIAGTGAVGYTGDGGPALAATFAFFQGVSIDKNGDTLIADTGNCVVRRIADATGLISTAIGRRSDSICLTFTSVLADPVTNDLYAADTFNAVVWVALATGTQAIELVGSLGRAPGFADSAARNAALITRPGGLAFDAEQNLIFADAGNQRIRRVRRGAGAVDTIAGTPTFRGDGGSAANATVFTPRQLSTDPNGNLYFVDAGHRRVRKIDTRGQITTVAGSDSWLSFNTSDPALSTSFRQPTGVASDAGGNIYVSDTFDRTLSRISAGGTRTLVSGAELFQSLALDATGRRLFAVVNNTRIVAVDPTTGARTPVAGNGTAGFPTDGVDAIASPLQPRGICVHPDGTLYFSDIGGGIYRIANPGVAGSAIRRLAQGTSGTVSAIALDRAGAFLYLVDQSRVVRLQADSGAPLEVAGARGLNGFAGDGGPALQGRFAAFPQGIAVGPGGEIYVADAGNNRIRAVTLARAATLTANTGNNQSGAPNSMLPAPLRVIARDAGGAPFAGLDVTFAIASGTATVTSSTATTGADGIASTTVQLGATPGAVVVTATAPSLPPVTFNLTIAALPPAGTAPRIGSVIALSGFGGDPRMVPGGWFEIYGSNFTTSNARVWGGDDFVEGAAPTSLGGVRVTVAGRNAFVYYVSAGQISIVAPDGLPIGADAVLTVINAQGTSNAITLPTVARAPGLLAPPVYKVNDRQYVVALFQNFGLSGPGELIAGTRRARAGEALQIFFVNGGAVTPALPPGRIASALHTLTNVRLRLGAIDVPVAFAGLAPGFVGLYQLNFVVPPALAGDQTIELTVEGVPLRQTLHLALE